jgi:hypothetical protein
LHDQELSDLEEQLRHNESDLDDKRRQFEEQRQKELFIIEKERYNLQVGNINKLPIIWTKFCISVL